MKAVASVLLALYAMFASMAPAHAHRLRVFATVESGVVSGYAYFVGGARAQGATVVFRDAGGRSLHRAATDTQGAFRWTPAKPQTIRITVDAGEGHAATITIGAERFSSAEEFNPGEAAARMADAGDPDGPDVSDDVLAHIEKHVEAAVARQMRPLLEAYEAAEARLRFNDIVGGIGMIVGVAGAAMWAASRRKEKGTGA